MHVLVERVLYYNFCSKQTSERLKFIFASLIKCVPGYVHYPVSLDGHWSWLTIHRFAHLESPEFVCQIKHARFPSTKYSETKFGLGRNKEIVAFKTTSIKIRE